MAPEMAILVKMLRKDAESRDCRPDSRRGNNCAVSGNRRRRYGVALLVVLCAVIMAVLGGCREQPEYHNDPLGNFDALADIIDTRYCFLDEKGLDWPAIRSKYRAQINASTKPGELFKVCGEMLDELQDGHVNLISQFNVSYYRKWWTDYPQDFNLRCLQEHYLKFEWNTVSGMMYKRIGKAGYIYYPSFSSGISENSLDYVLYALSDCEALIIDIRDNGGGLLSNVEVLVSRFIDKEITAGYISHKTGPGHNDFSEPYAFSYKPAKDRIMWHKPIFVLINRSSFSAANNFAGIMRTLPNVTLIGGRTGGGGGMPFTSELPNGWAVRFSAAPIADPEGRNIESGVDPSPNMEVHCTESEFAVGKDKILNVALEQVRNLPTKPLIH